MLARQLYASQTNAIESTIVANFESGVHAHATGTGKSVIALELLTQFHAKYPKANVMWICEQKSILQEQFDATTLHRKGFVDIRKKFILMDYSTRKSPNWTEEIQLAAIWKKPLLIIINRAFLTSGQKYRGLVSPLGLIIHDECHSIINATTRAFYSFALEKWPTVACIGFSATPVLEYAPFKKLLSQYSIYKAVMDKVILPPKIQWIKSEQHISYHYILQVIKQQLIKLPYKKILVWCGMIRHCEELAEEWSEELAADSMLIAIDTSAKQVRVEEFMAAEGRAVLFCAAKHREGSDIKNLDCCIFMDSVEDRAAKVFVQCAGRVLRRDSAGAKKYGLIIDISALSSIKICDRINQFSDPSSSSFPFSYQCETLQIHQKTIKLHELTMEYVAPSRTKLVIQVPPSIRAFFVRELPPVTDYHTRLDYEIDLINQKNLMGYLMQAVEILKITEGIPHVTRGSCGSSLLCYMLGISHVDPVRHNISFARFLTDHRSTLPDIDFDFPYNLRDEVFLQLELRWPGAIARISNHVFYHKKSALREAIRRIGIRRLIRKVEIHGILKSLKNKDRAAVEKTVSSLENTFRTYSLHCGGIVFYPEGVPEELRLRSKKGSTLVQIMLNKTDVAKNKNFKIDILSSRALAQLYECNNFQQIAFESWHNDDKIAELFCSGDNIGITLAESPLCRKAFLKFQPKTIDDLAICLAIIRPAARAARNAKTADDLDAQCIYDDDAISFISMAFQCDDAKADYFRRGLIKGDATIKKEFDAKVGALRSDVRTILLAALKNMRSYSFCKSHAYSYAQLIWKLAWMKVYRPKEFWTAAIKHCHSSYRRWVHLYEAYLAGVVLTKETKKLSIYAEARNHEPSAEIGTPEECLRRLGYWDFSKGFIPDCYYYPRHNNATFRGIIAASRYLSYDKDEKSAVIMLCVAPKKYIEVIVCSRRLRLHGMIGIDGIGKKIEDGVYECAEGKFVIF